MPTIPKRVQIAFELQKEVIRQIKNCYKVHPSLGCVEIVTDPRKEFNYGGPSIGKKREDLVYQALGKYLCFLDDDENIAPNYIETLLRLTNENVDVCCFRNISKFDNYWCVVDLSLHNPNEQTRVEDMVLRKPWHICPVKSEYAKQYTFQNINYGEDWLWFENVLAHCKSEAKTNSIIHQYNHSSKTSEADRIAKINGYH